MFEKLKNKPGIKLCKSTLHPKIVRSLDLKIYNSALIYLRNEVKFMQMSICSGTSHSQNRMPWFFILPITFLKRS